jgi:hypothetical protein
MHAAEDDVLGLRVSCGLLRQLEGVTRGVGELNDLIALIVMPEDEKSIAESLLGSPGTLNESRITRRWEITRAFHTALGVGIGTVPEKQQG